jgi:hypothetical protein
MQRLDIILVLRLLGVIVLRFNLDTTLSPGVPPCNRVLPQAAPAFFRSNATGSIHWADDHCGLPVFHNDFVPTKLDLRHGPISYSLTSAWIAIHMLHNFSYSLS